MALNKSSNQRTGPPCANCSTGTSLASENQRGQSPSPSVTRALSVGAHPAPPQRPSEPGKALVRRSTCVRHVRLDGSQSTSSHTRRFAYQAAVLFTRSSFPEAIAVAFGVDLGTDGVWGG